MHLLKPQTEDYKVLWNYYQKAMKTHIENIWGWDINWQKEDFQKALNKYNTRLLKHKGKVLGYVQFMESKEECYINMLIIEKTQQSKGYGKMVLDLLSTQSHSKSLKLRCFKVNTRAYQFYLDQDFKVVEGQEHFYLMTKRLSTISVATNTFT